MDNQEKRTPAQTIRGILYTVGVIALLVASNHLRNEKTFEAPRFDFQEHKIIVPETQKFDPKAVEYNQRYSEAAKYFEANKPDEASKAVDSLTKDPEAPQETKDEAYRLAIKIDSIEASKDVKKKRSGSDALRELDKDKSKNAPAAKKPAAKSKDKKDAPDDRAGTGQETPETTPPEPSAAPETTTPDGQR
jgi:hypothetical protein